MTDHQDERGDGRRERAARVNEEVLRVHPDEATGDIDPQADDLEQTPEGLRHSGRPTRETDPRYGGPDGGPDGRQGGDAGDPQER